MAVATRARGQSDTLPPRGAGKGRIAPERPFALALIVALLLHAPLIPTGVGAWLRLFLGAQSRGYDDIDASAIIPIDLDLGGDPGAAPSGAVIAAEGSSAPGALDDKGTAPSDAGVDAAPAATTDAGSDAGSDAGAPRKRPDPPDAAPPDAGPPPDAGAPALRDPISAAGAVGKISAKDANVQVLISSKVLRKHPLGASFSRLLLLLPSWRQFFADSPIDPIRDLDHVLITAPRFRDDSSKMVAVMDFNLPEAKIKAAIDSVVTRTNGEWMSDTPVPAARARIAAGDRIFAIVPGKKLLVVLPLDAKDQLAGLKQTKGFRNSATGIVISLVTPSRAFAGLFPVPESIKSLRVLVTPTADGGADVALEAVDKSPEEAQKHAADLTQAIEQVRVIDAVVTKIVVLDHTEFVAEKEVIKARVHVSDRQLMLIMGSVEQRVKEENQRAGRALPAIPIHGGGSAPGK
ncbi:MAG: hypothetical protein ABI193_24945 [Minicystis sp.]